MGARLTRERLDEILAGRYAYRTVEQLDRDVRDLLADREFLLADLQRPEKDTAPCGESTHGARAEARFVLYGSVPLGGAQLHELAPDFYGRRFMQLDGWLPFDWPEELIPRGTQRLEYAHVPDHVMPCDINVQVHVNHSGGRRRLAIEWQQAGGGRA